MTARRLIYELEVIEKNLKTARTNLAKFADEVDEYEADVMTHAELKRLLKQTEDHLAAENKRCSTLVADKVEIRQLIDEAMGWTSDTRQRAGKRLNIDSMGATGALKLFLTLFKKQGEHNTALKNRIAQLLTINDRLRRGAAVRTP